MDATTSGHNTAGSGDPEALLTPAKPPPPRGCRVAVTAATFAALVVVYFVRVSLGIVLISMVSAPWVPRRLPPSYASGNLSESRCIEDGLSARRRQAIDFPTWDSNTQGVIMAAFFYGYILTQAPGRSIARKLGGKRVMFVSLTLTSVLSFLTPFLTRYFDFLALVVLRAIEGLVQGLTYPAVQTILAQWAPPQERSKMVSIIYAGSQVGTVISLPIAGLLTQYAGWDYVFYLCGVLGAICTTVWLCVVHESPAVHPKIDPAEREYIVETLKQQKQPQPPPPSKPEKATNPQNSEPTTTDTKEEPNNPKVPWAEMFRSMPVYALAAAHFVSNWTHYAMLTCLSMYFNNVLRFNIPSAGLLSGIAFLIMWIVMAVGGLTANALLNHRVLTNTIVRQLFNTLGFIGPAVCFVILSFIRCRILASVLLIFAAVGLSGLSMSGWGVNHLDLAPPFAAELICLTNVFGTIPGLLVPSVVGAFASFNRPREAWQYLFLTFAGVYAAGTVVFWVYGSGKRQWWSYLPGEVRPNRDAQKLSEDEATSPAAKNRSPTGKTRNRPGYEQGPCGLLSGFLTPENKEDGDPDTSGRGTSNDDDDRRHHAVSRQTTLADRPTAGCLPSASTTTCARPPRRQSF